jgi:hypothetical protein
MVNNTEVNKLNSAPAQSEIIKIADIKIESRYRKGLIFIKLIIAGNRVAPEWIMLYVFTVGFLITTSLTLLEANKLQQDEIRLFNVAVLGVLLARAFLDYVIGEGFYFPEK